MDGPAVYPTNAPATAPIGPNTTAPDKAPKAASPPRSWANAPIGTSVKDTTAATISLFMCASRNRPDAAATTELRLFEGGHGGYTGQVLIARMEQSEIRDNTGAAGVGIFLSRAGR